MMWPTVVKSAHLWIKPWDTASVLAQLINEGIEAFQWTQESSKEFNDVVAISYHGYTYSMTSLSLTMTKI